MMCFIDCEFTALDNQRLLSIGIVADNGRELYVELAPAACQLSETSEFVHAFVLPQFGLMPHQASCIYELGCQVGSWLAGLERPTEVVYDYHVDMDLLQDALAKAHWWDALAAALIPTHVGYMVEQPEAIDASEKSWKESSLINGISRHHALADARALRAAFHAVHTA